MDISVILPAYNEEKYIEQTLQALKGRGEIIVVCNGCTDKTEDIAKRYADNVLVLKEKGVSKARNAGAAAATHNKLIFLDADILVDGAVLETIAACSYTIGTSKVKANSSRILDKIIMWGKSHTHSLGFCTGLIFCNRDIFEQAGKFEKHLSTKEDGRFLRRARMLGRYGVVDAYVYNHMRRFHKKGYLTVMLFWVKEYLFPSKKDYESVR